jgi:hypothetical protein
VPVLDAAGLIGEQPTVVAVVAEGDAGGVDLRQVEQTAEEVRGRFAALELGQLGYVFAAIAAVLVGLDRFLGLSTGWVRYITAELSLRKALADFQMDWVIRNAELADDAGEQKCPRERLALIKNFSSRIDQYVEAETMQWAAEFQGALAMLQTAVREAQEAARPGTVQVTVQRGAGIRAGATVYLDGEARGRTSNGTLTLTRVSAGGHEVAAVGEREEGGEVRAATSITVPGGGVVPITLKLE